MKTVDKPIDASTEKRILAAARDEFVAKGQAGARIQEIALRANVNKALIHYYFRTKSNLYEAAIHDVVQIIWTSFFSQEQRIRSAKDFRSLVEGIVVVYIGMLRENPTVIRMMLRDLADGGKALAHILEEIPISNEHFPGIIFTAISKAIAEKKILPCDPTHVIINIVGMCAASFIVQPFLGVVHKKMNGNTLEFDESFYQIRIRHIVDMITDGLLFKEHV